MDSSLPKKSRYVSEIDDKRVLQPILESHFVPALVFENARTADLSS